ncbi:MAG: hypothetical protein GF329_03810 [Candidatus Lokiarchaeota archaeon]|nr:hypothetical protein [Candidatus Lokiarchaeota archaeon]
MSKLKVSRVIMFKHGVSYFILEAKVKGQDKLELEFKVDEMDDILKSLFVLDTSEKGYISSISYDAAMDTSRLLNSVALDVPDTDPFSKVLQKIKGANIKLIIGSESVSGKVMGIEYIDKFVQNEKITEKLIVLLKDNEIQKIPFNEVKSFEILNESLRKDLSFYLETVILSKKKDTKNIVINCKSGGDDSIERKLIVSYFRESPIWKTSYRILMSEEGMTENKCLISGYCMVENITDQDWEEIQLTLVAGMPVSFKYKFYAPIFITRPVIKPAKITSARPREIEEELGMVKKLESADRASTPPGSPPRAPSKMARERGEPSSKRMKGITGARMDDDAILDKIKSQTTVKSKELGELFEYNIAIPVTIKRKQCALVPILSEKVKGKKILLYNKNEHGKNPSACLELSNNTDLTLERGPVTIIQDDNLAGEAIVPFMNKGDTRLLNYAVELAVLIDHQQKSQKKKVHRVNVQGHYIYEYYYEDLTTIYKIKNKSDKEKTLYIDHPKTPNHEVIESPVEPEETPNYWRLKIEIVSKDTKDIKILERTELAASYYLWNWSKEEFYKRISFYTKEKYINDELEEKLKVIADLIGRQDRLKNKKDELIQELNQMKESQKRLRDNIKVLGKTSKENTLREKYINKLTEQENKFETISKEVNSIKKEIEDLNDEITQKLDELKYR